MERPQFSRRLCGYPFYQSLDFIEYLTAAEAVHNRLALASAAVFVACRFIRALWSSRNMNVAWMRRLHGCSRVSLKTDIPLKERHRRFRTLTLSPLLVYARVKYAPFYFLPLYSHSGPISTHPPWKSSFPPTWPTCHPDPTRTPIIQRMVSNKPA